MSSTHPPAPQQQRRIKRQRRKLRGKYSGDCVSCDAKWSKCWYIASVDNQPEWEARLGISVRPCDDEVCFQCWDGKIRTSPKRKQTKFDNEPSPPPNPDPNATAQPTQTQTTTTAQQSGGSLSQATVAVARSGSALELKTDLDAYNPTSEVSPRGPNKRSYREDFSENEDGDSNEGVDPDDGDVDEGDDYPSTSYADEGDMPGEQEAVLLLSTAFRTFPSNISNDLDTQSA